MRKTHTLTGIALLVFGCIAATAGGQQIDGSLRVMKGRARFGHAARSGQARHTLKLKLMVEPQWLAEHHDPDVHALRVVLKDTVLIDVAPGASGYRGSRVGRWAYRGEHDGDRVRVKANSLSGRLRIALSRANLPDLRDCDGKDLPLTVAMAGTELETTASFSVRDGHVRRWMRLANDFTPGPGPGPGPNPGGDPQPVDFSVMQQGKILLLGATPPAVARSQGEWSSMWQWHHPGGTAPPVDFTRSMVVGVYLDKPTQSIGDGLLSGIRVVSVNDTSGRREVVWEEVADSVAWSCSARPFAPCYTPATYQIVLAPRSSLPVVFRERK
jgi:hypothetical protein